MSIRPTFSDDEATLLVEYLRYCQSMLNTGTVLSDAHKVAGRFCYGRLGALRERLELAVKQSSPGGRQTGGSSGDAAIGVRNVVASQTTKTRVPTP